jgi:transposase
MLNSSTLSKAYKNRLSDFEEWKKHNQATDWILMENNVGEYMSIDETAPSRGDLFTILSNKAGHGKKGTIASMVRGTKSEDLISVFKRIPEDKRLAVKEVTMDFSDSMSLAVSESFHAAEQVIDCFHVVQLATSALSEVRLKYKRKAMSNDVEARREHKRKLKASAKRRKKEELKRREEGVKKSNKGRRPNRKNKAYTPPRFANGDTAVELLTRSRYFIAQSRDKWTESQKQRASILFNEYPEILKAYELVDGLRRIFKKRQTPEAASTELEKWYENVEQSKLKPLIDAADTILSRQEHVVNYFNNRHTNASAESLNSKIKGFRAMLRGVSDLEFFMFRVATIFG